MSLSPITDPRLEQFAALVAASPHNLVSRAARAELLTRHVPECVELARLLPSGPQRVLDLGSGGGFPGMIIAIVRPELDVHLLDSTAKKAAFLRESAAALEVAVEVHTGRAEQAATEPLRHSFDIVTARAVAPLDRLLPWSVPFLRTGGMLYAVKGERWADELEQALPLLDRLGAHVVATPEDLPASANSSSPRVVVIARTV